MNTWVTRATASPFLRRGVHRQESPASPACSLGARGIEERAGFSHTGYGASGRPRPLDARVVPGRVVRGRADAASSNASAASRADGAIPASSWSMRAASPAPS